MDIQRNILTRNGLVTRGAPLRPAFAGVKFNTGTNRASVNTGTNNASVKVNTGTNPAGVNFNTGPTTE